MLDYSYGFTLVDFIIPIQWNLRNSAGLLYNH